MLYISFLACRALDPSPPTLICDYLKNNLPLRIKWPRLVRAPHKGLKIEKTTPSLNLRLSGQQTKHEKAPILIIFTKKIYKLNYLLINV